MVYSVNLDRNKCIGCGTCTVMCPENFEMRPDGKSMPKQKTVKTIGCNKQAEMNCPVKCIKVVEQK